MTIFIDSNEYSNHPDLIKKIDVYEIRNQNVDIIIDNVGIEIKHSWGDFYSSIIDKRLWKQSEYLKQFDVGIFIIIDEIGYNYYKQLPVIEGALFSIILDWKLPILIARDETTLRRYLLRIVKKLSKDQTKRTYANFKKFGASEKDRHIGCLAQIDGISITKAENIFKTFKNLNNIIQKTEDDFIKIDGIGKKLSERIIKFFKWRWNEKN